MTSFSRRTLLKAGALSLPLSTLLSLRRARAAGTAQRLIIFYFPDGVAALSQDGQPSPFHAQGSETSFTLSPQLAPLETFKQDCVFLNGISLGSTDSGSHPGGAKKLLTGVDGGHGESIDQHLARTVGAMSPHRLVYLGAMANQNNASGDKHISYTGPGQTVTPEDNPQSAFERLFGAPLTGGGMTSQNANRRSVLDSSIQQVLELQGRLGTVERGRLGLHLEALREVEQRVRNASMMTGTVCNGWMPSSSAVPVASLYDPARFPETLQLQMEILVQAMACGLTRVGVIQASLHTSELIMSRFPMTEMYDAGFDMRSHQASHYGPRHDETRREYWHYLRQRKWFMAQFASLLQMLKSRPEGDGTMLDNSLVLLCSEISDGNTHSHDNMPFVLAGRGSGAVRTGRLLQFGYERHGKLLASVVNAMGRPVAGWGDAGDGLLPGLLG